MQRDNRMIANIKTSLQEFKTRRELYKEEIIELNNKLDKLNTDLDAITEARELIQKAAQLTQRTLEVRLTDIVSQALDLVFDGDGLGFVVRFVTRRNTTECDMFLTEAGEEYDPLGQGGFGAADVISFALRIAMWRIKKSSPIMVFDEPFRNLDDHRIVGAAELAATLSHELGIQMIIVSHEEELRHSADKAFKVIKKNGVSSVKSLALSN